VRLQVLLLLRRRGGSLKIWNVLLTFMLEAMVLVGVKAGLCCGFWASLRV
jgi:hypothetical protein